MNVLVDTSVWIQYFNNKKNKQTDAVDNLIDDNQICINNLILSELIPFLRLQRKSSLIELLQTIRNIPIHIDWNEIIELQYSNLKNGINKVGIPDLIILQNVLNNSLELFTFDKHFYLMSKYFDLSLFKH